MLRILKKALAKLRYRGGCHRRRSRNYSIYLSMNKSKENTTKKTKTKRWF
jgi:hypothetical protein